MATIDLGKIKFNWRGTYAGGTAYVPDDVVYYMDGSVGSSYMCVANTTGNAPSSGGTLHASWEYLAKGQATSPTTTQGDLIVRGASADERLAIGTAGKALKVNASANGLEYGTAGRILQLVTNEKGDVVSVSGQNNGSSFADLTGINVTITPTVASSKILVHFCLGKVSHGSNSTGVRFTRSVAGGSASSIKVGDADGNRKQVSSNIMGSGMINAAHAMEFIYQFVDTPTYSVGQAIVYQMQILTEGSGNFVVNRTEDDTNNGNIYFARAFSTITAMEVSA
mgnify:CR=1 FL=1